MPWVNSDDPDAPEDPGSAISESEVHLEHTATMKTPPK